MQLPNSPQLRFLLRASGFFVALLALWWMLLLSPMMSALRVATELLLHLAPGDGSTASAVVGTNGDWMVRVPISESLARTELVQQAYGHVPGTPPVNVRSVRLAIAARVPSFFTLGFPLFWALMLAAPRSARLAQVAALGTAALALLAVVSLVFYVAFTIVATLKLAAPGGAVTVWNAAEYLNLNVLPYLAPVLLAVGLHRELREKVLAL
jgi:hypothetical protein